MPKIRLALGRFLKVPATLLLKQQVGAINILINVIKLSYRHSYFISRRESRKVLSNYFFFGTVRQKKIKAVYLNYCELNVFYDIPISK